MSNEHVTKVELIKRSPESQAAYWKAQYEELFHKYQRRGRRVKGLRHALRCEQRALRRVKEIGVKVPKIDEGCRRPVEVIHKQDRDRILRILRGASHRPDSGQVGETFLREISTVIESRSWPYVQESDYA